jgi:cell division protein FtsQ
MTRKQARRRKQKPVRKIRLPRLPMRGAGMLLFAVAIIALSYHFSAALLDRPIASIMIEGPFQRVSALQIEEAIGDELGSGFFTANLERIRSRIISLTWGRGGLLNTRGELFVTDARHVPAELPRLSGPKGQSEKVAERYLDMREKLMPSGLDLREVTLDARGAWTMTLTNGIEVRLGRRDVDTRSSLFLDVAASIIASREADIEFVDMRYSNGFTIGWKGDARSPERESTAGEGGMVAGLSK